MAMTLPSAGGIDMAVHLQAKCGTVGCGHNVHTLPAPGGYTPPAGYPPTGLPGGAVAHYYLGRCAYCGANYSAFVTVTVV